jgi:hypothetical protein
MMSGSMQNHAWHGPKTCARRQEKQAPDRASEATSVLPIFRS